MATWLLKYVAVLDNYRLYTHAIPDSCLQLLSYIGSF